MGEDRPARLSEGQRNALVCVGMGVVNFYNVSWRDGGFFSYLPQVLRVSAADCPEVGNVTASCKALHRLGLLALGHVERENHGVARLSPAGEIVFEQVVSPAERAAMLREDRDTERRAVEEAARKAVEDWRQEHADELAALRHSNIDRAFARSRAEGRLLAIAMLLGDGANNVDELVAELRTLRQSLHEMDAQHRASVALWEELSTPPKAD